MTVRTPSLTALFGLTALLGVGLTAQAGSFRYAEDRAPGIVHPIFATTMSEARINELVFESLFTDSAELASVPQLARTSSLSPDKTAMRISLRTGVKWHDGTPFTADDVVFTIQAMQNEATGSPEAGRVNWISTVRAVDRTTVELRFLQQEYAPEDKLHFKILPAHKFSNTALKRTDAFRNRPIGTGPWTVVGFNDDNSVSLQKYANYWGDAGLSEVTMREVADKNYQSKLLVYESLEGLVRVLPRDLATLQNDRKVELYPYQTNSWWYVGFNNKGAPFDDSAVRKAITLLVDVPALLDPIGTGDRVSGPFVPSSPFYHHDVPLQKKDAALAKSLLRQAGYTNDGQVWTRDGKPLKLRLAALKNLETAQDVVINLQTQLQNEGVQLETEFLTAPEWKSRIWGQRDFDLILSTWSFDRNEDIYEQFHTNGARNFVAYSNPEVDELLDQARGAVDPQQKKLIMRNVHAKVSADAPMVFLWTLDSYAAMSTKVKNVVVHPFYFFTFSRNWTVR